MKFSRFGDKFSGDAGILSLMQDLGTGLGRKDVIMMGGGNPGHVPEVQRLFQKRLQEIAADREQVKQLVALYDPPQGNERFRTELATLLGREYGWPITADNICLTCGSQGSFFLLFNMLAGDFAGGGRKRVLLPLAPEYIGYGDLGLNNDFFVACRPGVELLDHRFFKYRIDFSSLEIDDDIGAICVSRPTNPTGNVLTDNEMDQLANLAAEHSIPLIVDNAYGVPFPGILYAKATPAWNRDIILCMSLSKFGLPAARTGIVVANTEIIRRLAGANAILNLAPGSMGPMLAHDLVASGEILRLSSEVIRPFYERKLSLALEGIETLFTDLPCRVHIPEGAMFLWLWFEDLPISSGELYARLKRRGVLVVAGDYFFPGFTQAWTHRDQCIRITYSQDEDQVRQGLAIIAEEVGRIYREGC